MATMINEKIYPKIDCGYSSGYPFTMNFLFLPQGITVYSGSTNKVREVTDKLQLCHAYSIFYPNKNGHWTIHGKILGYMIFLTYFNRSEFNRFKMRNGNAYRLIGQSQINYDLVIQNAAKHNCYSIFAYGNKESKILGFWRKLPRHHLTELGIFQKSQMLHTNV